MKHPRTTSHLVGHAELCEQFKKRLIDQTLPNAFLFVGPAGVGKATFAYQLAYSILKGSSADTLGAIPSDDPLYRRIAAQSHGDLLVLERSKDLDGKTPRNITVEQSRGVSEFLAKTPMEGGWRVIIIDSIDEMNVQAMNAILKGLEEPPSKCIFILICHQWGRLLPTIISRCERVAFKPLAKKDMQEILGQQSLILQSQHSEFMYEMAYGSAGRLIRLIQEEGEQLYSQLCRALESLTQNNWQETFSLIKQCIPSAKNENNQERLLLLGELLGGFLAKGLQKYIIGQLSGFEATLFQQRPLEQWTEIWEKIQALFRDCERLSLDPFQTMVHAFGLIIPLKVQQFNQAYL